MGKCIYCKGNNSSKLSREHVISKTVLQYVYGNRKAALFSSVLKNEMPVKIEQVVKDVCVECNSRLSNYDNAGLELVRSIDKFYDARQQKFYFSSLVFGWLLKTHLNYMRTIPNRRTGLYYLIDPALYYSIINFDIAHNLMRLYVRGRKGEASFWGKEVETIPFFSYSNWELEGELLFSYLRIKAVDTFIILPSNNTFRSFSERIDKFIASIMPTEKIYMQRIPIVTAIGQEFIYIDNSWPMNEKTLK